jgi:hypothetical protein
MVADGARKRLLARIHLQAGPKGLALTDESYRDVLQRITGHRSAALCEDRQLYDVLKEFDRLGGQKRQGRPIADSPMARRCRALWLSLFNLDEVENGSEQSLAAFVKRQTGREDMRFCTAEQFASVIDALKDWCRRSGMAAVDTNGKLGILPPKRALVREQWRRLHEAGWAKVEGDGGLMGFAQGSRTVARAMPLEEMAPADLDNLATKLGVLVRRQQLGRRHQAAGAEPA